MNRTSKQLFKMAVDGVRIRQLVGVYPVPDGRGGMTIYASRRWRKPTPRTVKYRRPASWADGLREKMVAGKAYHLYELYDMLHDILGGRGRRMPTNRSALATLLRQRHDVFVRSPNPTPRLRMHYAEVTSKYLYTKKIK